MNKFVKFPLVLGIVGIICTGALSIVYEVTKETITYNKNKTAIDLLGTIVTDISKAEPVLEDYDTAKASKAGITNMFEVSDDNGVAAYGYLAETSGFYQGITFLLVLSSEEEIILGFDVVSHNESSDIGGVLLADPEFSAQFTNISFDNVNSEVDGKAGATKTYTGVLNGVNKVIEFHREIILSGEGK